MLDLVKQTFSWSSHNLSHGIMRLHKLGGELRTVLRCNPYLGAAVGGVGGPCGVVDEGQLDLVLQKDVLRGEAAVHDPARVDVPQGVGELSSHEHLVVDGHFPATMNYVKLRDICPVYCNACYHRLTPNKTN